MPASRLKMSFHMMAMATTGTTDGRKKIVRIENAMHEAEALEAVGLSEQDARADS